MHQNNFTSLIEAQHTTMSSFYALVWLYALVWVHGLAPAPA